MYYKNFQVQVSTYTGSAYDLKSIGGSKKPSVTIATNRMIGGSNKPPVTVDTDHVTAR